MKLTPLLSAAVFLGMLADFCYAQNGLLGNELQRFGGRNRFRGDRQGNRGESRQSRRERRRREKCLRRPNARACRNRTPRPPPNSTTPTRTMSESQVRNFAENFIRADRERVPNMLQLVFHSCVGRTGCDGCINTDTPSNTGLSRTYAEVVRLWEDNIRGSMSLADFVVMLGTVAGDVGLSGDGGVHRPIPFVGGRQSCADPLNYDLNHRFPQGDEPNALEFLNEEFGLSERLAIALLGAHSLGECKIRNTGFDGAWDSTPFILDNNYYRSLIGSDWQLETLTSSGKSQWRNGVRMMLHADMAIHRNLGPVSSRRDPTCQRARDCPSNVSGARHVRTYSSNPTVWERDFVTAFQIMVQP